MGEMKLLTGSRFRTDWILINNNRIRHIGWRIYLQNILLILASNWNSTKGNWLVNQMNGGYIKSCSSSYENTGEIFSQADWDS